MEILRPTGMHYCIIHYCQITADRDRLEERNSDSVIAGVLPTPDTSFALEVEIVYTIPRH